MICALSLVLPLLVGLDDPAVASPELVVNSTADRVDANPGDGICDTGLDPAGAECTLRAAIQESNASGTVDEIVVPAGTYTLTVDGADEDAAATGDLDVTADVTIAGAGAELTVVDAGGLDPGDRAFQVLDGADLTLWDMTIRGGDVTGAGGGVSVDGTLTLNDARVEDNRAGFGGGGLHLSQGRLNVVDTTVTNNRSAGFFGGGIYVSEGSLSLVTATVTSNSTMTGSGGGIYLGEGDHFAFGTTVANNFSSSNGGGIYLSEGSLSLVGATVRNNAAGSHGGGIYKSSGGLLTSETVIERNSAGGSGAGLYNSGGTVTATDTVIQSNSVPASITSRGAGLYNTGGSVTFTDGAISLNQGGGNGAGIYQTGGPISVLRSTVHSNFTQSHGGGVYTTGEMVTIDSSTVSGNRASNGSGGAVYTTGDGVTLRNSTVSGNRASRGGGVFSTSSPVTVDYTTVTANQATGPARGGGLSSSSGDYRLTSAIVAGNTPEDCSSDPFTSLGHNLDGDGSCGLDQPTDLPGSDPRLGSLADNGGPTSTHALAADSPAVDAADRARCPDTDQRGTPRPHGDGCDIGAFEWTPDPDPDPDPDPEPEGLIASVEFTQAIQELQDLDDLRANGPTVPIVQGKPMAIRVFLREVDEVTTVEVRASGSLNQSQTRTLIPGCSPDAQRLRSNRCLSHDFYVVDPGASVDVELEVLDRAGTRLDHQAFAFSTRQTTPVRVRPLKVCDDYEQMLVFFKRWKCGDDRELGRLLEFTRSSFPGVVELGAPAGKVEMPFSVGEDSEHAWWGDVVWEIQERWRCGRFRCGVGPSDEILYGMVRPDALGPDLLVGGAALFGKNAAASRTSAIMRSDETGLGEDREVADETVAHEIGHNFGRLHAPDQGVFSHLAVDGCWLTPRHDGRDPDWPHGIDPRIQDVGFDMRTLMPVSPDDHFDWMSYCTPQWVSSHTYVNTLEASDARGSVATASTLEEGEFWLASGRFVSDTEVALDPLFRRDATADTGPGSGEHRIEVRDGAGDVRFTRLFDPHAPHASGTDVELPARFAEFIPVQEDAEELAVVGPAGQDLASLALDGQAPTVAITHPAGGERLDGLEPLEWQVSDPDSDTHTFVVDYSRDGGATWEILGSNLTEPNLLIDTDDVPGSLVEGSSLLRVLASDGVNTGVAVSNGFTVPTKPPNAAIIAPDDGRVAGVGDLVWLQALALDPDDGALRGDAVAWHSDLDGFLGHGPQLPVTTLSAGVHRIDLTVTDSDGNTASDAMTVTVDDAPPRLDVAVGGDDGPPEAGEWTLTAPVAVSIDADDGDDAGRSGLASVDYSLDGGQSWNDVPLDELPFSFDVGDAGPVHLVVLATDLAGNRAAEGFRFLVEAPTSLPPVADAGPDQRVECAGHDGGPATLDATGSSDPLGSSLAFEWSAPAVTFDDPSSPAPTATFPPGTTTVTLTVTNASGLSDTDSMDVVVEDTVAPQLTVDVSPTRLWPPNHTYVQITLDLDLSDGCDPGPAVSATAVSSEPDNATGDGNTTGDIKATRTDGSVLLSSNTSPEVAFDPLADRLELRAERAGHGDGRIYTVTVTATDASGNEVTDEAVVIVPKSGGPPGVR